MPHTRRTIGQLVVVLTSLAVLCVGGGGVEGYQFLEPGTGGCGFPALGPGNVDFVVDATQTAASGQALLDLATMSTTTWSDVATAQDVYGDLTPADVDYTFDNAGIAWGINGDGQSEVVQDVVGDILTALGADPAEVLGIGIPIMEFNAAGDCSIVEGLMVINGAPAPDVDELGVVIHEFGHILGLAHSSVGQYNTYLSNPFQDPIGLPSSDLQRISISRVPTMHPTVAGTGLGLRTLEADDIAGLSELYPEPSFGTTFGSIVGTVTRCADDTPVEGANVRISQRGEPSLQMTRFSAFDGNGAGRFEINGVPPGTYDVILEPMTLSPQSYPFASDVDTGFAREYYGPNSLQEGLCTDPIPDTPAAVTVAAGETTTDIDFRVQRGARLAFVIDDTGSMGSEIAGVRATLTLFIQIIDSLPLIQFPNVAIFTFKDTVTLRIQSNDPDELQAVVDSLFASSGGDCAESSNAALLDAWKLVEDDGVVMLWTDADSRPNGVDRETIEQAYLGRGVTLNVILTDTCGGGAFPFADPTDDEQEGSPAPRPDVTRPAPSGTRPADLGNLSMTTRSLPYEPLGFEDAVTTFSQLATETGGVFFATGRPFDPEALQILVNAGTNISVSSVVPAVGLVRPSRVPRGITMDIEVLGANTNWTGSSLVTLGTPDVVVNGVTVLSPTALLANVTVPATATLGFFDVTVTTDLGGTTLETASGVGALNVTEAPGFPLVVSAAPSSAARGQSVQITVFGVNTNFDATSTVALRYLFGNDPWISVDTVSVVNATTLVVGLTIAADAPIGYRDVDVTTGAEFASGFGTFLVTSQPPVIPRIVSITPAEGAQGTFGLAVQLVGENTNFVDGVSVASFRTAGIEVVSTTVIDATTLTAVVNVAEGATAGFADVLVTTGSEVAVLLDGFFVSECAASLPPDVTAELAPIYVDDDSGRFTVTYACSDPCDQSVEIASATLNGVAVGDGQVVVLELDDDVETEWDDGFLVIEAPSFLLEVVCVDESGNSATATASPIFEGDDDDDDDQGEDDDDQGEDEDRIVEDRVVRQTRGLVGEASGAVRLEPR